MRWFPVIGFVLGGVLALSEVLLSRLLAREVVDLLLITLLVGLTRGLHQDGLADTIDGLAGGRTPAERLAIMRDPHIGALGTTGLVLILALRYAGLWALPSQGRLIMLVCMPVVGRWTMVLGAWSAPYARAEGGLAAPFISQMRGRDVVWATVPLGMALWWALGPIAATVVLAGATAVTLTLTWRCRRLCGGITGDLLGAVSEVSETVFLLAGPALLALR